MTQPASLPVGSTNSTVAAAAAPQTVQLNHQTVITQQMHMEISSKSIELTENQKKLLGMTSADDPSASLEQQVDITLKGKEQRLLLMQKLMQRKHESNILILRNMVGPDDVDSELENEITGSIQLNTFLELDSS